jgi:hypothetical protein
MTVVAGRLGLQFRPLRFIESKRAVRILLTRYRSEIRMLDIPAVVQKVAFPVLLAAGTLLGKCNKFKDAPEPVLETQAI